MAAALLNKGLKPASERLWLVVAPDFQDAGARERRLKVRVEHIQTAAEDHEKGILLLGGAMLHDQVETPTMCGSSLLFAMESEQGVWDRLRKDVYATGNVWDFDQIKVYPIKLAFPK